MSNITLTIPNDDHVALRAFGKALEEMAREREPSKTTIGEMQQDDYKQWYDEALEASNEAGYSRMSVADVIRNMHGYMKTLEQYGSLMHSKAEVDTTAQQVESLSVPGATHIITEQVEVGEPVAVDGGLSQGYIIKTEEIPNPVDSNGTPWDERIHSASKALNSDGTWRLRRKPKDMNDEQWSEFVELHKSAKNITAEESENIAKESNITVQHQMFELSRGNDIDTPEPPVTPPGDDFHTDAGVVTEQTVAGIPPIPVPPVATGAMLDALAEIPVAPPIPHIIPAPVADEQVGDFPKLMKFLTERHGRITVEQVNTLLAVDGLTALTDLNAHPDKIGPFVARVKAHLGE